MMLSILGALIVFLIWLHAGYHTFAQQQTGLQILLVSITILVLMLERQVINLVLLLL